MLIQVTKLICSTLISVRAGNLMSHRVPIHHPILWKEAPKGRNLSFLLLYKTFSFKQLDIGLPQLRFCNQVEAE